MTNKITIALISIFCIGTASLSARDMVAPSPLSSAFVFPAGYASYNMRGGYRKFDGIKEYEYLERDGFFIFGGTAGVRIPLKKYPRLRFQPTIEAGWGNGEERIIENAIAYSDGRIANAHERINLFTFGAVADAHILIPIDDINRMFFISAGAGLHRNSFFNSWETKSGREVLKTNKMSTVGFSLNVGGGLEYRINRQRAVALGYNFRFWDPVAYTDFGDMFPMGVGYTEYFYSHSLQIHILLPRSQAIGFR